ncbi:hypothetical protein PCANB_000920 [Pneumocystis canis]|nr:hypothetical protein PCANB_000920 [Pneumocystis canis]
MVSRIRSRGRNRAFLGSFHANRETMVEKDDPEQVTEKPREERSYLEFYTNLDISMPLRIIHTQNGKSSDKYLKSGMTNKEYPFFESNSLLYNYYAQNKESDSNEDRKGEVENLFSHETPRFSFRTIQPFEKETKYTGRSIIDYGYQETDIWSRPSNTYIRFIEESEETLANRVEYDMDEQEGDTISREFFEIVLTKIEKEWIELDKKIPKDMSKENLSPDDSKCSICDDGECENINAIVFCDGCNLAVHQDCYGIPYIPEGQWLCRKCLVSPQNTLNCIFCPNTLGAFKQTSDNRWAHLLCALWIPEVTVANSVYQEPIDSIHKIPSSRWKLICYICQQKMGASIQCANKSCYKAFHVTCARKAKLYMPMKKNNTELKAYCDKHVPNFWRDKYNVTKFLNDTRNYFLSHTSSSQSVTNNCNSNYVRNPSSKIYINLKKTKTYPLIPAYIQDRILNYIHRFPIRKKASFIADIFDAVKKREEQKRKISYYLETVADCLYFPITDVIKYILSCIEKWDKNKLFSYIPVNTLNYNSKDNKPICLSMISKKIEDREYANLLQFKTDIMYVFDNAIEQNNFDTIYYKTAVRFKRQCEKLFSDAENYTSFLKIENGRMVSDWSIFEPKGLSIKEYVQIWPGDNIRAMSPLSEITEEEFKILEQRVNMIQKQDNKQNIKGRVKSKHNLRSKHQKFK